MFMYRCNSSSLLVQIFSDSFPARNVCLARRPFFIYNLPFQKKTKLTMNYNGFCSFCVLNLSILSLYGQISSHNFDYFIGFINKICFGTCFLIFSIYRRYKHWSSFLSLGAVLGSLGGVLGCSCWYLGSIESYIICRGVESCCNYGVESCFIAEDVMSSSGRFGWKLYSKGIESFRNILHREHVV